MVERQPYWFPAKRYGWGWGWPTAWQGRAVLAAYFVALIAGIFLFPPDPDATGFILYALGLTMVLMMICWRKGEPPRWRWGK